MSPDLTDDLRVALRRATAPVVARPDLAARARAAADRRHRRRTRYALVLAPVAVAAVVVAAVLVAPGFDRQESLPAADQVLLDTPTGGDLAGRADFLDRAVRAFLAGVRPVDPGPTAPTAAPGTQPVGDPHVLWAGTTRAGPAAVVVQAERTPAGPLVAIGYLAPGPRLVAVSRPNEQDDLAGAYVGAGTALAVDRGRPLAWSYQHTYLPGGGIRLTDRPVRFTGGVAVLTLPAGVDAGRLELTRPGPPEVGWNRVLRLGNDPGAGPEGVRLPWADPKDPTDGLFPLAGADAWSAGGGYSALLEVFRQGINTVHTDRSLYGSAGDDLWYAYGDTPDGRRVVATDMAAPGDPSRAYAVLAGPGGAVTVVDGGPVDPLARLPFRVRLPDGQGWLVAAQGRTLAWAGHSGADAALLPAAATTVRVDGVPVPLAP